MSISILMITSEMEPDIVGGLGIVSSKLARHITDEGHRMTIVTINRRDREVKKEHSKQLSIFRFPKQPPYYQNRQFVAKEILPHIEIPDVVHLQCVQGLELATYLKEKYHTPIIYTSHSMGIVEAETTERERSEVNASQEAIYELADAIVCPSRMERTRFVHYYPHLKDKVEIISNGIDASNIKPKRKSIPNRLLYVGRIARSKGLETLLLALALLSRKKPRLVLHVVGHGSPSSMKRVKDIISKKRLKDRVVFHPWVEQNEVYRFYKASTVVIIPSHYESFGMVMLEAMAHGTPVIVTTEVGAAEDFSRSVVIKVPPKDPRILAESILHLTSDVKSLKERGAKGIAIARIYSWERPVALYLALYRRLVKQNSTNEEAP